MWMYVFSKGAKFCMFYTPVWFDITGSSIAIYNQKSYSDKYKSYFTSPIGQVEKHKYQWVVYEIEWNVQKYTMRILEWKKHVCYSITFRCILPIQLNFKNPMRNNLTSTLPEVDNWCKIRNLIGQLYMD